MSEQLADFNTYYWEVAQHVTGLGYIPATVALFKSNIEDCYYEGKSIEECVQEIF